MRGSRGVARGRGRTQTAAAASVARAKRTLQQNQQTTDVFKTRYRRTASLCHTREVTE